MQSTQTLSSDDTSILYEGLRLQLTPAPLWKRCIAFCVDMGIILAVMYPLFILGGIGAAVVFGISEAVLEGAGVVFLVIAAVIALVALLSLQDGYFILSEKRTGTTLGKRLFGLRVASSDGRPITWGQAAIRDVMRYVDCFMIFPGLFAVLLSDKRRRLGDMMAGTIVVHSASREKSQSFLYLSAEEYAHIEQLVQPASIDSAGAEEYLKFAFKRFVLSNVQEAHLDQQWHEYLVQFVENKSALEAVSVHSLMRFFAERTLQWKNARIK